MGRFLFASIVLVLVVAACTPAPVPTATPTPTATSVLPTPTPTPTPTLTPVTRLASHLFVPVGESRSIEGLGELLETINLTEPPSLVIEGTTLTAIAGGLSCLRFAYREAADENTVQTLCVVSFDETGDCSGLDSITLDLQRFLGSTQEPVGNANLLEHGEGLLYAACRTTAGAYRLQQPVHPLPPLYYTIVDALGDGSYSLGDDEMAFQRAGVVVTFSGKEIRPPWIVTVSREVNRVRLTDDLRIEIEFNAEDCSVSPGCTFLADVVRPGDVLRISTGLDSLIFEAAFEEILEAVRDRFFQERIGLGWSEIAGVNPDAIQMAFNRLVALDIMGDLIAYFDDLYGLRDKEVVIGYWQPWAAIMPLPYPYMCFPDDIVPGEQERCLRIERAIQAEEERRITQLRETGYDLWYANFIDYRQDGRYSSFDDLRPHFSIFGGIVAGVGANSTFQVPDIPATLAAAMRQFAAEVGSETPIILSLNGPPITAQTGGVFCEAEICPSDFAGMYEQIEAALHASLESLSPEQFQGFGVALFEGAHFDIRQPYERFPGFSLNRVGETGYNNPVLNIYRAQ